ncbi:MAG TPA: glutathione S-transferase N-terminal domain-containing protein [Solirubrobacteraceae bacterium]|nr:glutathione S-transferase N-terminal domain-containing protein [Solirubrobacteraceae bacterium]
MSARAKLYWFPVSHPAMAVKAMLELKAIPFETVEVLPGSQRIHLRLAGFRHGTVPALKLDGRRVQGSLAIPRALEQAVPEPPLYPADPALRARVEEAEAWGERELQNAPRLLIRRGLVDDHDLRRWFAGSAGMPAPGLAAYTSVPVTRYYARAIGADEAAARGALRQLPAMLDRADALLADGTLATDPPNAATLQILASIRAIDSFADLQPLTSGRPVTLAARELFPDYPGPVPPFVPSAWLGEVLAARAGAATPK